MINRNISHIDIPAKDRAKMASFYQNIFGWEIQSMDDRVPPYTVRKSGNLRGGFPNIGGEEPDAVLIYLGSDDIEADLKMIEENGGKTVLQKTEIPGVGHYALFTDPTGNKMGLFSRTITK